MMIGRVDPLLADNTKCENGERMCGLRRTQNMNIVIGCGDLVPAENTKCEHSDRMSGPLTCGQHKMLHSVRICELQRTQNVNIGIGYVNCGEHKM